MKNVLFAGLGSIGQRHLRNLKTINPKLNFFAIRKKKNSPKLSNKNTVLQNKFLSKENNIKEIRLNEIKHHKIDTAFITNPSSLHLKYAIIFAKKKLNLFIEKPISHSTKDLHILEKLIKKQKIFCAVGFQTRYDDNLNLLKKIIKSKKFGKIINVDIHHQFYLPFHHKYEDYRVGYAAKKKLGGGVLLCFIHEIDYANFLFKKIHKIQEVQYGKKSSLEIDVEDYAKFKLIYKIDNYKFPVNFNLDFLSKKLKRFCRIKFQHAELLWKLNDNTIFFKKKWKKFKNVYE
jgi:predicted dehydrogenase